MAVVSETQRREELGLFKVGGPGDVSGIVRWCFRLPHEDMEF